MIPRPSSHQRSPHHPIATCLLWSLIRIDRNLLSDTSVLWGQGHLSPTHPHGPSSSLWFGRGEIPSQGPGSSIRTCIQKVFQLTYCMSSHGTETGTISLPSPYRMVPARSGLKAYSQSCMSLSLLACSRMPRCSVHTANVLGVCRGKSLVRRLGVI